MTLRVSGQHSSLSIRKELLFKAGQKRPKRVTRKRPESDQSKQEDAIIELLKENPYISRKEISGRVGLHESSVKRRLASLQEKEAIKRIGPDKGGYWEVQKGF